MTFAADETGPESSLPREIYEITHGATAYYLASGDRDITLAFFAGFGRPATQVVFVATPAARTELSISPMTADIDLTLQLAASHPFAQRYVALSSPPQQIFVRVFRIQLTSQEIAGVWSGYVTSAAFEGHIAKFRIPSRASQSMQRSLPSVLVDVTCPHVLYDSWCAISRASFTVTTTVASNNGRVVNVATMSGHPDQWAQFGELLHMPSGERMTIIDQTGTQVTMQAPIVELRDGDAVQVFAGCAHDINTCRDKFANVVNFGGLPFRPTQNIFLPTGIGVLET